MRRGPNEPPYAPSLFDEGYNAAEKIYLLLESYADK